MRKITLFVILMILLIMSVYAYEDFINCQTGFDSVDEVKPVIKLGILQYLKNPKNTPLHNKIFDLITQFFFVNRDCYEEGDMSDTRFSDIAYGINPSIGKFVPNLTHCTDGKPSGECGLRKGYYCNLGILLPNCTLCGGCDQGFCQEGSGECISNKIKNCTDIINAGYYILDKNIKSIAPERERCIKVIDNNVQIDCLGETYINISDERENLIGIWSNKANTTVKNCRISIENGTGIQLEYASEAKITTNTLISSRIGLKLDSTQNSIVQSNIINSNSLGFFLSTSNNNLISSIQASSNDEAGIKMEYSNNNIIQDSTFQVNIQNNIVLINSQYNNLINTWANSCQLEGCDGIFVSGGQYNNFTDVRANSNVGKGIYLEYSNNNLIKSSLTSSNHFGVYIYQGVNNNVTQITSNLNTQVAIYLNQTMNNNVERSSFTNSKYGIYVSGESSDNMFKLNTVCHNSIKDAVCIYDGNTFLNNTMTKIQQCEHLFTVSCTTKWSEGEGMEGNATPPPGQT